MIFMKVKKMNDKQNTRIVGKTEVHFRELVAETRARKKRHRKAFDRFRRGDAFRTWQSIREATENDPEPFAALLGIKTPEPEKQAKRKSFTETMTGRGKRTSEDVNRIGFVKRSNTPNPILCRIRASVDTVLSPASSTEREPEPPTEPFIESVRVRDNELSIQQFNPVTGEFVVPMIRKKSVRDEALETIGAALTTMRRAANVPTKAI